MAKRDDARARLVGERAIYGVATILQSAYESTRQRQDPLLDEIHPDLIEQVNCGVEPSDTGEVQETTFKPACVRPEPKAVVEVTRALSDAGNTDRSHSKLLQKGSPDIQHGNSVRSQDP